MIERVFVSDPTEPRIVDYVALTDMNLRRKSEIAAGLFMAESLKVLARAVSAGYEVRSVLTEAKWLPAVEEALGHEMGAQLEPVTIYVATPEVVAATTGYKMHRGPMAAMQRRPLASVSDTVADHDLVLILDGLVDHTNVGAAFRSAAALGVGAILVTPTCADPLYRRSVRVSMGTVFSVPWTRLQNYDDPALDRHAKVALGLTEAAVDLPDLVPRLVAPIAIIVGTEGDGLPSAAIAAAQHVARIPMSAGVDSLNVAAAVAVACFAIATRPPMLG